MENIISSTHLLQQVKGLGPVHTKQPEFDTIQVWNYRSSVRTHSSNLPCSAWQREAVQPANAERHAVCRRAGVQVAGVAQPVWQLAHCIHPNEPVVEERGAGQGVRIPATRTDSAHQTGGGLDGQHHCQSASRWHWCVKKTDLSPSASPGAVGPPRFIWLPRMLEQP